jgi:predicted transcriptional regulator
VPTAPRSFGAAGLRSVSFKLPPDLINRLDDIAVSEGRSRNAHVRLMLSESVELHHPGEVKAERVHRARQKRDKQQGRIVQAGARA